MFLKSMEIRGFKSFADKTELVFKKGVTAVVGPNGSGKSNISDAVRWVLGEQSVKSLRGGKMEDVIFAGTQFRKPVGLAQVSLTLDNLDGELNIDYSDVTISRRLYRSGESEYYINNTQCRLKDIQELFMDTGIGKEGYSIIGQGKIDAILSGKPEERRSLLEEAAGIVKFKNRKEEAEKKLNNTEQNLVRINDILSTYEERLEPLRIENEKAKIFLDLSSELKEKEVNLIIHSIDKIDNKINSVVAECNGLEEKINELLQRKQEAKVSADSWNEALERHELELQEQKQQYYVLKEKYQNITSENKLLEERLHNLNINIERAKFQIDEISAKISGIQENRILEEQGLKHHQDEQLELNVNITNFEKKIVELNSNLSGEETIAKNLKDENVKIANIIANNKNQILMYNNEKENIEKRLAQLKITCENYRNSLSINANTKAMLEEEAIKLRDKIENLENEIKNYKLEIGKFNGQLTREDKKLKEFTAMYNKYEANYQMLLNLDKQYEGYNRAVKTLLQHIEGGKVTTAKNKCYVLGEVINVKKEYETAIEIALGGAISDIITDDESIAKTLISYLKTNNIGRATFLPLTIVNGKSINNISNLAHTDGYIGVASELIGYDKKFKNAVEYVLGRTIISRDMDSALKLAKVCSYSYKIVTLSGEVVNPGGSLTGGSVNQRSSNVIGRKREIEESKENIEKLKIEIDRIAVSIETTRKKVKELDEKCLNLRDNIYFENIEITKNQGKINAIVADNNKITESLTDSNKELQSLNEALKNSEIDIAEVQNKLAELIKKSEDIEANLLKYELQFQEKTKQVMNIREDLTALKIKKAQVDEIVISKIKDLERIAKDAEELHNNSEKAQLEIDEAERNISDCNNNIEHNIEALKGIEASINELEEVFKEKEIEKIRIKENIKISSGQVESISLELIKKDEEKHKQDIVLTKHNIEKEALYKRLNEELNLTYAEALSYRVEIENLDKFRRDIEDIKKRITSLGVVNVGAIEEYKETKEKFTFMNAQKEDLINAKNELLNVIEDMTENMRVVFNENFSKLRVYFKETFKELFKGGNADLILAEGDELTANIEINVEPPGKKLQNINLMSGGEKVLSAIALLFAILKMKPTPFCILDEIEAALDDANVFRYAEFLKKFSSNIQFIVITHRKGTMESSDVLYGVTMEEKGVSKIVSVDLAG